MKGLGFPLLVLFLFALAALPLVIFDARRFAGKFIRANALLIALGSAAMLATSEAKRPGALTFIVAMVFGLAFLKQVVQRRGIPILESMAGLMVYNAVASVTDSVLLAAAVASSAVFTLTLASAARYPIRSHHADS
ncbi:hypothetical protein ACFFGH_18395 [Lysobacter korlensis]|uniref:Uncharacterized protein n=1 Tax=Lysobacter korlensis TaxID=553636 RepID=A0ABV6RS56_9GAMM